MKKEYEFSSPSRGGKSKVIIEDGKLTISRPGVISKFSHGFTGDKTMLIKNISAVQFKPAGFARGYLQFIFVGSKEVKSGIMGAIDENIIYFDAGFNKEKMNKNAKEIKDYIENYNSNKNLNNVTNIYSTTDKYDQLAKIKKLLDDGILSKEEFEKEKQKILQNSWIKSEELKINF